MSVSGHKSVFLYSAVALLLVVIGCLVVVGVQNITDIADLNSPNDQLVQEDRFKSPSVSEKTHQNSNRPTAKTSRLPQEDHSNFSDSQEQSVINLLASHETEQAQEGDHSNALQSAITNGASDLEIQLLELEEERALITGALYREGKPFLRAALKDPNSELSKINQNIESFIVESYNNLEIQ